MSEGGKSGRVFGWILNVAFAVFAVVLALVLAKAGLGFAQQLLVAVFRSPAHRSNRPQQIETVRVEEQSMGSLSSSGGNKHMCFIHLRIMRLSY